MVSKAQQLDDASFTSGGHHGQLLVASTVLAAGALQPPLTNLRVEKEDTRDNTKVLKKKRRQYSIKVNRKMEQRKPSKDS